MSCRRRCSRLRASLAWTVCDYIRYEGVEVVGSIGLEVADHLAVGRLDSAGLVEFADRANTSVALSLEPIVPRAGVLLSPH